MSVNIDKLRQLVQEGKSAEQIKQELGNISTARMEQLIFRAYSGTGKPVPMVAGLEPKRSENHKLNRSGLNLPAKKLEDKFPLGSEFQMEKHDDRIVLTLVTKSGTDQE